MDTKLQVIIIAAVVVIAGCGVGAYYLMGNNSTGDNSYDFDDLQLMVYGNANGDFTIDNDDKALIQKIIDGQVDDAKTDADAVKNYPFADVNNDKKVDSSDVAAVEKIINKTCTSVLVACLDYDLNDTVVEVKYPMSYYSAFGVDMVQASIFAGAEEKLNAWASFPVSYKNAYSSLDFDKRFSAAAGATVLWDTFTSLNTAHAADAFFIDSAYRSFMTDTYKSDLSALGVPTLIYSPASPNGQTSAAVTLGFLCGGSIATSSYDFAVASQNVLNHIMTNTSGLSTEDKASFITAVRSVYLVGDKHAQNEVGTLGGGIAYHQVNSAYKALYSGTGSSTAADALADFKDADAYFMVASYDFGGTAGSVEAKIFSTSTVSFYDGVLDKVYNINNLLPGAVKAAYAAECLYPSLFAGYGDSVAQTFIDNGTLNASSVADLHACISYADYQATVSA